MKRLVALVLALMLLCGPALAEIDWTGMSDEEIRAAIDSGRNELVKRGMLAAENFVLVDQDGVQVYLTGNYSWSEYGEDYRQIELEAIVINDSDKKVTVSIDGCYVNGWEVYASGIYDTAAGKKQKDTFDVSLVEADVTVFEEIEDIEFTFRLYDSDEFETIANLDPVDVQFNAD